MFRRVPLKSEAAQRRVALDRDTAELFAELVAGRRPDQPVFTDPTTGGWWSQHRVNFAWAKVRAIACTAGLSSVGYRRLPDDRPHLLRGLGARGARLTYRPRW